MFPPNPDRFAPDVFAPASSAVIGGINAYVFVVTQPNVSVSGRVTTPDGRGLRNAGVTIIDQAGVRRTATTSSFGLYSFDNIAPGQTYTISIISRLYRFQVRTLTISSDLINVDFVGLE